MHRGVLKELKEQVVYQKEMVCVYQETRWGQPLHVRCV